MIIRFFRWIVSFLELQIFITLISLPILISWGLPISLLSPVGNIIFTPFVTLFLLLSSLTFFCEILYIPNRLLISGLELLYTVWQNSMNWIPFNPLIGFTKPPSIFLISIPIITIMLMYKFKKKPTLHRVIFLTMLFMGTYALLACIQPTYLTSALPCNRGVVTVIYDNGTVTVIDPGVIGQNRSAYSWIEYTLIPHITTTTGKTNIDHFIFLQQNKTISETLLKLAPEKIVKKIYIPEIQNNKQEELTTACQQYDIELSHVEDQPMSLALPTTKIKIVPKRCKKANTGIYSNLLANITYHNKTQTVVPYAWQKRNTTKNFN